MNTTFNMSDRGQGNGQERGREPTVKSANKWESANFGDDDQKQKFLRLMGGMKKQHTGRFVIGDTTQKNAHARTDDENKKMEETLQSQYKIGLNAKISGQNRRHVGLGFSEPEKTEEEKPKGIHTRFSDSGDESDDKQDAKEKRSDDKRDRERKEDVREKKSDDKRDRERKEYRDEKRRDGGARERSIDDASSSREKHRSDRHRDRDEKSSSRGEDRKYDRDDISRQTKEGRKHRQEEESEETSERKRKKHKDKKYSSDSD